MQRINLKQIHAFLLATLVPTALVLQSCSSQHQVAVEPQAIGTMSTMDANHGFRKNRPATGDALELSVPVAEKRVLKNGLTVLAIQQAGLPLVSIEAVVRSGSASDPKDGSGVAGFVAAMLKEGTTSKSATAIADEIETRGASLGTSAQEDALEVTSSMLTENFDAVFDIMADVLLNPAFAPKEIERVRAQRLASLEQLKNDPSQAATLVFRQVVYGAHPYGHAVIGQRRTLSKVTQKQLQTWYANNVHPANTAIVVVGDMPVEQAFAAVEKRFSGWVQKGKRNEKMATPTTRPPEVVLVERPGAPQSQLKIGHLGVARNNPDYYPLLMCNAILGGLFNSRINMNLRESKGYTYGARSNFDFLRAPGSFFVATGVRTDATKDAILEVIKEIQLIRRENVTDIELQNAKNRYSLSLPGYFQTVQGIAAMTASLFLFDLPLDYYQQLPSNIANVTIADIRRVAEQYLHDDKLSIVVVGDRNTVEQGLSSLERGPVKLRDAEGNPL